MRQITDGSGGGGEEPNHTTARMPGPLKISVADTDPNPDPLVRDPDPDPSIIKQK